MASDSRRACDNQVRSARTPKWLSRVFIALTFAVMIVFSLRQYIVTHIELAQLNKQRSALRSELQRLSVAKVTERLQLLGYLHEGLPVETDARFWSALDEEGKAKALEIVRKQINHDDPQVRDLTLKRLQELPRLISAQDDVSLEILGKRLGDSFLDSTEKSKIRHAMENVLIGSHPSVSELRDFAHGNRAPLSSIAVFAMLRMYPEEDVTDEFVTMIRSGEQTREDIEENIQFATSFERAREIIWAIEQQLKSETPDEDGALP